MLRTFGRLEFEGASLTRKKPLLLLAYLAIEGRQTREELADLFYGDAANPRDSLSTDLRRLENRTEGAPGGIERDWQTVAAQVPCDYLELKALFRAGRVLEGLTLYRDPFLKGFYLPGRSDRTRTSRTELDDWIAARRREAADGVLKQLLLLIRQSASKHDLRQAVVHAELASRVVWDADATLDEIRRVHQTLTVGKSIRAEVMREEADQYGVQLEPQRQPITVPPSPEPTLLYAPLPRRSSRFIGRDAELLELSQKLCDPGVPLLTLTGPGGIGKTRVALQLARDLHADASFPDGVAFVPLEAVNFANLIPVRIAQALQLELSLQEEAWPQVTQCLRSKRVLLVLDNVEHLLEGTAALAELLGTCDHLTLLVTSRERLGLEAETVYPIPGLAVPQPEMPFAQTRDAEALQLFEERARRAQPDFELTPDTLEAARRVCELVGGSPLALELAATWLGTLSPEEIAEVLEQSPEALTGNALDLPARQRSSAVVFECSWRLLEPSAQNALRRLSVFQGGFVREAAREIAGVEPPVLRRLTDASLLQYSGGRFCFHALVRHHCRSKLASEPGLERAFTERHCEYFLALAESAREALNGPEPQAALERLDAEAENLRAAWTSADDPERLARLALAFAPYLQRRGLWDDQLKLVLRALEVGGTGSHYAALHNLAADVYQRRGDLDRARDHLERALAHAGEPHVEAEILNALGGTHYLRWELNKALGYFDKACTLFETLGDGDAVANAMNNIAAVHYQLGDLDTTVSLWERILAMQRQAGNLVQQARTLNNLGTVYRGRGELETALLHFERAYELRREAGDVVGTAITLSNMAGVNFQRGAFSASFQTYKEVLSVYESMGDRAGQALTLNNLGTVHERRGNYAEAQTCLEAAERIQEAIADPTLAMTLNNLALVCLGMNRPERGEVHARRALALAESTSNPVQQGYALTMLAATLIIRGRLTEVAELLRHARQVISQVGDLSAQVQTLYWSAQLALRQNDAGLARRHAEEALELAEALGLAPDERLVRLVKADALKLSGDVAGAARELRLVIELDRRQEHHQLPKDQSELRQLEHLCSAQGTT